MDGKCSDSVSLGVLTERSLLSWAQVPETETRRPVSSTWWSVGLGAPQGSSAGQGLHAAPPRAWEFRCQPAAAFKFKEFYH